MELKAEHKIETINYDQIKDFESTDQTMIAGAKNILLYQKDLYSKLLDCEEDTNKKHEIEEKIKELDSLISQIDELSNHSKTESK